MSDSQSPHRGTREITIVDLALELHRLAAEVMKSARCQQELVCLSNLTAITSLTRLMSETLSEGISVSSCVDDCLRNEKNPIGFCAPMHGSGQPRKENNR